MADVTLARFCANVEVQVHMQTTVLQTSNRRTSNVDWTANGRRWLPRRLRLLNHTHHTHQNPSSVHAHLDR